MSKVPFLPKKTDKTDVPVKLKINEIQPSEAQTQAHFLDTHSCQV